MRCQFEFDLADVEYVACSNFDKLIHSGTAKRTFCHTQCPYRVEQSEGLGDTVAKVLNAVGITKERVAAVTGGCGCEQRQETLNNLLPYNRPQTLNLTNARKHLMYRVYPMAHNDGWQWNLEQLAKRWHLFDGKKILSIGYDSKTVMPDAILQFCRVLGMEFDHVIRKRNVPNLREVVTFVPMIEEIAKDGTREDDLVFTAHSKGAQYKERADHNVWWSQLMYEANLDYWPLVRSYLMRFMYCGAFRRYGAFDNRYRWDYSGTFYWFRLHDVLRRDWRNVDQFFAGTESWPGQIADINESACVFHDSCGDLYSADYWRDRVLPDWQQWQERNAAHKNP